MGMLRRSSAKKQTMRRVKVMDYFLLTLSKGSALRKCMKCLRERTKNLKLMVIEKSGMGIYGMNIRSCMAGLFTPKE
jgi:hypothetical protein